MHPSIFAVFALGAAGNAQMASVPAPPPLPPYGPDHMPAPVPYGAEPFMGLTHAQLIAKLGKPTSGSTNQDGGTIWFETKVCMLMVSETAGVVDQVLGFTPDGQGYVAVPDCLAAMKK